MSDTPVFDNLDDAEPGKVIDVNELYPHYSNNAQDAAYSKGYELGYAQRAAEVPETPNKWIPSPKARRWIFGVLAAAGPIVVFYGLATNEEVVLWLGLGATILGTPASALAERNVPRG